ncbi:MAG: V-type ATP synthase subunit I [Oscillospiraceae bacterium]|nr:V-type ATP synthase subunit I [Oscillospiraceae bacterium]
MAIAKMKRLELIALQDDREALLEKLLRLGCVHLSEPAELSEELTLRPGASDTASRQTTLRALQSALAALQKEAPQKSGLLSPRPRVAREDFLSDAVLERQLRLAETVNDHTAEIERLQARENRLRTERMTLLPWRDLDIPLELTTTRTVRVMTGTLPSAADWAAVQGELSDRVEEAKLHLIGESKEQKCVLLLCHQDVLDAALEVLRSGGFALSQLSGMKGTVAENLCRLDRELAENEKLLVNEKAALSAMGGEHRRLKQCIDRVSLEIRREESRERLLTDGCIFCLNGWVPQKQETKLESVLSGFDCAWSLRDPEQEEYEEVPVLLENNRLTRSLNTVTEMYSLPAYGGVDPNPLMAPFFILFFGMMMADMAYGLLMVLAAVIFIRKARPAVGTRNFMELVFWCGLSTLAFGAMTGSFFGDFIPQLLKMIDPGSSFRMPALFTPLDDTIAIMIGSLVLGVIQIFTGMAVSVVQKIRTGHLADAVWEEFTWWVILIGVALLALGIGNVGGVPVVLCAGVLMLCYGAGRNAKGFGKVTALVGAIYNGVTGYFSDILSYVRLMALMLAGSVIAQVFNTLGSVMGNVVLFFIVAMIGNALNLALNLLGCYVHDLRLQCLEFFGRFYQEGGKPFRPLAMDTKYVEIIKEEN